MKITASKVLLLWAILVCGFSVSVGVAHADISQYTGGADGSNAYYASSGSAYASQRLGAGFSGAVTSIALPFFKTGGTGTWTASIECFTDDFYLTSCGQSATSTTGTIATGGAGVFSTTTISGYTLYPGSTYELHVAWTVSGGAFGYLDASSANSWTGGDALIGTAGLSGTVVDLAFNLSGSGFFGPTTGVSFGDLSTSTVAGGSFYDTSASSTLDDILTRCGGSGNVFSEALCATFAYLFVPDPAIINGFTGIPAVAATRFPFSWIAGVKTEFDSLTVSSTTAMTALAYNYHDLGIGSTTPMGNILPNFTVFSKDTIETYISPTLWATFQTLIAAGMWLGFFFFEFNRARRMAKKV